jgi:hypothetical protein
MLGAKNARARMQASSAIKVWKASRPALADGNDICRLSLVAARQITPADRRDVMASGIGSSKPADKIDHLVLLLAGDLGKHRQRDDPALVGSTSEASAW